MSAERELKMGRAVVEAAIGRKAPHVAYPFGDNRAFGRRHVLIATQLDFASAVTAEPGVITATEADQRDGDAAHHLGRTPSFAADACA